MTTARYELLVIILDDVERLPRLIDALMEAGVSGTTLYNSIGGYRARNWLDEIGLSGLHKMFGTSELRRKTLLAVVEEEQIDGAIAAAERVMDGFGRANSGILFTVPVRRAIGIQKPSRNKPSETLPVTDQIDLSIRETPLEQVIHILNIQPVTIPAEASLLEAARAFVQNPYAQVAAVVSETDHLLGLITLRMLANYLFFGIMPEVFYGEITTDMDTSLDFGKMANVHTVADIMLDPVAIHLSDTVGEAFAIMHKYDISGLPLVDDHMHVVGFVTMQDLLNLALSRLEPPSSTS